MAFQTETGQKASGFPPTIGGVQAAQEQHLNALRSLARKSRVLADHLVGAEPQNAEQGQPPTQNGAVYAMHDNMMSAAVVGEEVSYNLDRIGRALGLPPLDEANIGTLAGALTSGNAYEVRRAVGAPR